MSFRWRKRRRCGCLTWTARSVSGNLRRLEKRILLKTFILFLFFFSFFFFSFFLQVYKKVHNITRLLEKKNLTFVIIGNTKISVNGSMIHPFAVRGGSFNLLSPVQTEATLLANKSQHCTLLLHVASLCTPCCMFTHVVSCCWELFPKVWNRSNF